MGRRTWIQVLLAVALIGTAACSDSPRLASDSDPSRNLQSATAGIVATPGTATATATATVANPCGIGQALPGYRHVVWIWMENQSFEEVIGSTDAPFENAVAHACGLAGDYHGIGHPSLPSYLAATSGSTFGVTNDDDPSKNVVNAASLFSQIDDAGLSWRSYEEAMPTPCATTSSGLYHPKHNPAAYYLPLQASCQRNDLPLDPAFPDDINAGTLPAFAFVTPNMCNDTHNANCPITTGDAWLNTWVTRLVNGPNYRNGDTVIVITWDESHHGDSDNHIPTIVIAPSVSRGTVVPIRLDHYSLLRMTEDLLGLPPLGYAATAPGMSTAFGL
ncbi:MAG: alkaline phosphatase family protein [Nakamurella sp.]